MRARPPGGRSRRRPASGPPSPAEGAVLGLLGGAFPVPGFLAFVLHGVPGLLGWLAVCAAVVAILVIAWRTLRASRDASASGGESRSPAAFWLFWGVALVASQALLLLLVGFARPA